MPTTDPAARWPNYQEADFILKDYKFASGEMLPELKLHYRTIGIPQKNAAGEDRQRRAASTGQHRHRRQLVPPDPGRRATQAPASRSTRATTT